MLSIREKIEQIKDNKDHKLYKVFKVYPNPEIQKEGDTNSVSVKEVERRYYEDSYKIIGRNWWLPFSYEKFFFFNLYNEDIKWMIRKLQLRLGGKRKKEKKYY